MRKICCAILSRVGLTLSSTTNRLSNHPMVTVKRKSVCFLLLLILLRKRNRRQWKAESALKSRRSHSPSEHCGRTPLLRFMRFKGLISCQSAGGRASEPDIASQLRRLRFQHLHVPRNSDGSEEARARHSVHNSFRLPWSKLPLSGVE